MEARIRVELSGIDGIKFVSNKNEEGTLVFCKGLQVFNLSEQGHIAYANIGNIQKLDKSDETILMDTFKRFLGWEERGK